MTDLDKKPNESFKQRMAKKNSPLTFIAFALIIVVAVYAFATGIHPQH